MTEPLWVDPSALSGAGGAVAAVGDGLGTVLNTLTASFNADTGQDAAGMAFGFAYRRSGKAIVAAITAGVKAARHTGYLVQGSATNYSRAEAAADISGRSTPLPPPPTPADYAASAGEPDVNGAGVTPPALWYLAEAVVGDVWPDGDPDAIRTAAAAWSAAATPLYQVTGDLAGPYATIGGQQTPDREPMKAAVRDIGTAMSGIAGNCQTLANELGQFGADVESTQNAVRDLLQQLASMVKSVASQGILGTVIELFDGDDEQRFHEIADDIKAVIANHKRQSAAREAFIQNVIEDLRIFSGAMEIVVRKELVDYLGEDAGRVTADVYDAVTDTSVGLVKRGINAVDSAAGAVGNPAAVLKSVEGLGKLAFTFNAATAPIAFALDPKGSVDLFKSVTNWDDTVTNNRPFIGIGESLFDVGSMFIPGGAGAKAVSEGSRVVGEAGEIRQAGSAGERTIAEGAEITQLGENFSPVPQSTEGITDKLDQIAKKPADPPPPTPPPPPGRPVPPAEPGPARPGGPSSAPPDTPVPAGPTESRPPNAPASEHVPGGESGPAPTAHGTPETPANPAAASPTAAAGASPAKSPDLGDVSSAGGSAVEDLPKLPDVGGTASSAAAAGDRLVPAGEGARGAEGAGGPASHGHGLSGGEGPGSGGGGPHGPGGGGDPAPSGRHGAPPDGHDSSPSGDGYGPHDPDDAHAPRDGHEPHDPDHPLEHIPPEDIPPLMHRETPYDTGGIRPQYVGEQNPGGHFAFLNPNGVRYLDDVARQDYRLTIHDGHLYDAQGNLFDTSNGVSAFANNAGRAIFVMDKDGNIFASTYQRAGFFHHSSFFSGGDVAAAGELVVKDGKIEIVSDRSGHYMPSHARTEQMLEQLVSQGVDMTDVIVNLFVP